MGESVSEANFMFAHFSALAFNDLFCLLSLPTGRFQDAPGGGQKYPARPKEAARMGRRDDETVRQLYAELCAAALPPDALQGAGVLVPWDRLAGRVARVLLDDRQAGVVPDAGEPVHWLADGHCDGGGY